MDNIRKRVGEEILVKLIAESIITAILVGGAAIWGTFELSKKLQFASSKGVLWVAGITLGVGGGSLMYRTRKRRMEAHRPRFDPIDSDFVIEWMEIRYHWKSPQEIVYTRKYKLRPLRNDVDRFPDRFRWSGDKDPQITALMPGHRIDRLPKDSLYDKFDICFDRSYGKGELIEAGATWHLEDLTRSSRPFISREIQEPTGALVMIVELPTAWGIESVAVSEGPDASARKNVVGKTLPMTNGKATWSPDKPIKLLHCYEIKWQWPQNFVPK